MNAAASAEPLASVAWLGSADDGRVAVIDQLVLPRRSRTLELADVEAVHAAIASGRVDGGSAVGIAGAYGVALQAFVAARVLPPGSSAETLGDAIDQAIRHLETARPTSVHLARVLVRVRDCFDRHAGNLTAMEMAARLLMEARRIQREDGELCERIAERGGALLPQGGGVLTIGAFGALSSGGIGTAGAAMIRAQRIGRAPRIHVLEGRPSARGSRISAPELRAAGLAVQVHPDTAAAGLLRRGAIATVLVGAEGIGPDGSILAPVGTYGLAVLARQHGVPFLVAAPVTIFSPTPLAEQDAPAWDLTPPGLVESIITGRGVIHRPDADKIAALVGAPDPGPML